MPADTKLLNKDDTEALKADIDAIRKDIKQLFDDVKTITKTEASELKDAAVGAARERRDDLEGYVKEHPLGALAAAAGTGFILALLLGRN